MNKEDSSCGEQTIAVLECKRKSLSSNSNLIKHSPITTIQVRKYGKKQFLGGIPLPSSIMLFSNWEAADKFRDTNLPHKYYVLNEKDVLEKAYIEFPSTTFIELGINDRITVNCSNEWQKKKLIRLLEEKTNRLMTSQVYSA